MEKKIFQADAFLNMADFEGQFEHCFQILYHSMTLLLLPDHSRNYRFGFFIYPGTSRQSGTGRKGVPLEAGTGGLRIAEYVGMYLSVHIIPHLLEKN